MLHIFINGTEIRIGAEIPAEIKIETLNIKANEMLLQFNHIHISEILFIANWLYELTQWSEVIIYNETYMSKDDVTKYTGA